MRSAAPHARPPTAQRLLRGWALGRWERCNAGRSAQGFLGGSWARRVCGAWRYRHKVSRPNSTAPQPAAPQLKYNKASKAEAVGGAHWLERITGLSTAARAVQHSTAPRDGAVGGAHRLQRLQVVHYQPAVLPPGHHAAAVQREARRAAGLPLFVCLHRRLRTACVRACVCVPVRCRVRVRAAAWACTHSLPWQQIRPNTPSHHSQSQ